MKLLIALVLIIFILLSSVIIHEYKNPCLEYKYTGKTEYVLIGKVLVPQEEKICLKRGTR